MKKVVLEVLPFCSKFSRVNWYNEIYLEIETLWKNIECRLTTIVWHSTKNFIKSVCYQYLRQTILEESVNFSEQAFRANISVLILNAGFLHFQVLLRKVIFHSFDNPQKQISTGKNFLQLPNPARAHNPPFATQTALSALLLMHPLSSETENWLDDN